MSTTKIHKCVTQNLASRSRSVFFFKFSYLVITKSVNFSTVDLSTASGGSGGGGVFVFLKRARHSTYTLFFLIKMISQMI